MNRSLYLAAVVALAFTAAPAPAAVITWSAATGIVGDTDVSTNGALVGAVNLGGDGNVTTTTVNGVMFNALPVTSNNITFGNFNLDFGGSGGGGLISNSGSAPFAGLSAAYRALLISAALDDIPATPMVLTITGLVVGQTYEFQWWTNRSANTGQFLTTATAGNMVTLNSNTAGAGGGLGQYAIGTFTADATTQTITYTGSSVAILNGFQLRQASATGDVVPEPATVAVFGLMALGAAGLRRRTKPTAA